MYNKAILIGRLVADPELRTTPNGTPVCSFRIAVNRPYSSKEGSERVADFIDIVAWRQQAEFVCRYFSKGKPILVEGSIQTRSYTDKNDQKRTAVEVVADTLRFVESKSASQTSAPRPLPSDTDFVSRGAMPAPSPAYSSGNADDFAEIEDDGDLPF